MHYLITQSLTRSLGIGTAVLLALNTCTSDRKRSETDQELPNIVIIFADDMGYADAGCFGAEKIKTPNLDRMAEEGIRFTNFYVAQAVCSASRAALLTGCYSNRVSILGALGPGAKHGIHENEMTIAELVKQKDYATAIYGKWHLGHREKFLPTNHGFDEYFGLPYSNDMWPYHPERPDGYPPLPLIEGTDTVKFMEEQTQLTTWYTEHAVEFIKRNKDKSFFLYVAHNMPHVPLFVSDKYEGTSEQGLYGDVITEIDWSVGQILSTLKKYKIDKNTLVIFTSDNGPWLSYGDHAGSALPLREGKGTAWDGGVREPCVMRWPEMIPAGTVCNEPVMTIDILPTVAKITGTTLPDHKIDGECILPLMTGEPNATSPHEALFFYYGRKFHAVRSGKWKLHLPHPYRTLSGRKGGTGGIPVKYDQTKTDTVLFNLENDISESTDVKAQHPDIVKRLLGYADQIREELGDENLQGKKVRLPGFIEGFIAKKRKVSHLGVEKSITLEYPPAQKYNGGAENALLDGIRGTMNFNDGLWQGFEDTDLIATIDMGEISPVTKVSVGFLQDIGSWIYYPVSVEFGTSSDGKSFKTFKIKSEKDNLPGKDGIKDVFVELGNLNVRYIQIKAENIGTCPEEYPGAGGKAWLFADEIVVE